MCEKAKRLALAMGWKEEQLIVKPNAKGVIIRCEDHHARSFGIQDNQIMWRIAERLNCFPVGMKTIYGMKWVSREGAIVHSTPNEAIYESAIRILENQK